jgi:hypothetical protein
MPPPALEAPASTPANSHPNRAPAARACPFAGRACAGACAPGTALPLGYRKARKHLAEHLCAIRMEHDPSGGGQVPADLVPTIHAVAFEPARAHLRGLLHPEGPNTGTACDPRRHSAPA